MQVTGIFLYLFITKHGIFYTNNCKSFEKERRKIILENVTFESYMIMRVKLQKNNSCTNIIDQIFDQV